MAKLDDATKLLAIGLLNFSDDEGYFYADEKLIRSALRAFDDDSSIVRRSLAQLVEIGYIDIRVHPTHGNVGCVTSFKKHQRVDRPKSSEIKELYDSMNDRRIFDDDSTNDRRWKGREGKGKDNTSTSPQKPDGFDEFWISYPRKVQKGEALKAWAKMKPDLAEVLKALEWQKRSPDWTKDDGQFIPYPASYLHGMRWTDEKPATQPQQRKFPSCL